MIYGTGSRCLISGFPPFRAALDLKRTSSEIEVWVRREVGRQVKGSTDEIVKKRIWECFHVKSCFKTS